MNQDKLVVGVAGMPGAGKSLFVEAAVELGYTVVTMGDVIREETRKRGLELNPQNVGKVMLALRQEGGNCVIAEKCIPKIEGQASQRVLIDGLRSLYESDTFRAHFKNYLLFAVHASPEVRFKRLSQRGRSDDPQSYEVFRERDLRELSVGLGNTIAMAQHVLVNDNSVEAFKAQVKKTLELTWEKWLKK